MTRLVDETPPALDGANASLGIGEVTQFLDANVGAQRASHPLIAPPALAWQKAYWRPPKTTIDEWHRDIDSSPFSIFMALRGLVKAAQAADGDIDHFSPNLLEENSVALFHFKKSISDDGLSPSDEIIRHDTFRYYVKAIDIKIILFCEYHLEYWTITISVDYSNFAGAPTGIFSRLNHIGGLLQGLQQNCCDLYVGQASAGEAASSQIALALQAFRAWCEDALGELFRSGAGLGELYADFTTVSLGLRHAESGGAAKHTTLIPNEVRPTSSRRKLVFNTIGVAFNARSAVYVIGPMWPVIKSLLDDPIRRVSSLFSGDERATPIGVDVLKSSKGSGRDDADGYKPEISVSLLQNNTTILLTANGDHLLSRSHRDIGQKVYLFITSHNSKWRHGRLIDRVFSLEMTRLAAVRDIRDLTTASKQLDIASKKIDDFIKLTQNRSWVQKEKFLVDRPTLNPTTIERDVREAVSHIDDGVLYRVEKSAYYVARFERLVQILNPQSVVGFSNYATFAKRRFYDSFDFIAYIGRRYNTLINSSARLVALYTAESDRERSDQHKRAADKTVMLLDNSEIIIIMPLAYYFSHVAAGMFHTSSCWSVSESWSYIAGFVFAAAVAIVIRTRHWIRERQGPKWAKINPIIWFSGLAVIGFVAACYRVRCP